ncbi:unnamed protein product (mitochondrion) [Plasmodiophora brassicae]|uniref:Uncharacterized protein n=2 Tax=Plasmodiophora brassicae TaxID=37360 RepID=A0A3P3YAK0_PLABS|nr:unnamed protein product [Plasmodiophora brassicae]
MGTYLVDGLTSLDDVLAGAVGQCGLSVLDPAVRRARDVLDRQYFWNASALRLKRQMAGSWRWLLQDPFALPIGLADMISNLLDGTTNQALLVLSPAESPAVAPFESGHPSMSPGPAACSPAAPDTNNAAGACTARASKARTTEAVESFVAGLRGLSEDLVDDAAAMLKGMYQPPGEPMHLSQHVCVECRRYPVEERLVSYRIVDPVNDAVFVPIQTTIRLISGALLGYEQAHPVEVQLGQRCRSKKKIARLRVSKSMVAAATSLTGAGKTWDHTVCCSLVDIVSEFAQTVPDFASGWPAVRSWLARLGIPVDEGVVHANTGKPLTVADMLRNQRNALRSRRSLNSLSAGDDRSGDPGRRHVAAELSSSEEEQDFIRDVRQRQDDDSEGADSDASGNVSRGARGEELSDADSRPVKVHRSGLALDVLAAARAAAAAAIAGRPPDGPGITST